MQSRSTFFDLNNTNINLDANCILKIISAVYKKNIAICKQITNAEKLKCASHCLTCGGTLVKAGSGCFIVSLSPDVTRAFSPFAMAAGARGTETAAELSGFSELATAVPASIHILQQWEDGQGYRATEATCTEAFQLSLTDVSQSDASLCQNKLLTWIWYSVHSYAVTLTLKTLNKHICKVRVA